MHIRIATRKSALALWQADEVSRLLREAHGDNLTIELVKMTTTGDQLLQESLATQGGKGLFVKELERGLLEQDADIAVHSMKDVPIELPPTLHLPVILERANPCDAFVSNTYDNLDDLPDKAIVGTSSSRRACQIMVMFPHLEIKLLRGNVNTRLAKLDDGQYDAIILAVAGLQRLGFNDRIRSQLSTEASLPAIGQGAIGIECRENDTQIENLIAPLNHTETNTCVTAERAISQTLEGGCQLPIAGFAQLNGNELHLRSLVGMPDGSKICRSEAQGPKSEAVDIGQRVAADLSKQGADQILASLL
ncbi:MAG: hydroxymethylbilane synthase [Gammaproteobacteria bacterium]